MGDGLNRRRFLSPPKETCALSFAYTIRQLAFFWIPEKMIVSGRFPPPAIE